MNAGSDYPARKLCARGEGSAQPAGGPLSGINVVTVAEQYPVWDGKTRSGSRYS